LNGLGNETYEKSMKIMNIKRQDNTTYQIIPQNDRKCVWMEAGIVSYKICDRKFECETCPRDVGLRGEQVIHQRFPYWEKLVTHESDRLGSNQCSRLETSCERLLKFKLDEHRFVNPGHCWIKILKKNKVKIGIDDIVATALGGIDEVILPSAGEKIKRSSSCGQVIQFEHVFTIVSPVTGQVIEVNNEIAKFPNQLTLDPLNKGWMMVVEPENLEQDIKYCRSGDALMSWYLKEFKWFECHLSKGFDQKYEHVGVTLTDGGEISRNLRNYLPKDQYRKMIISLLGLPDSTNKGCLNKTS